MEGTEGEKGVEGEREAGRVGAEGRAGVAETGEAMVVWEEKGDVEVVVREAEEGGRGDVGREEVRVVVERVAAVVKGAKEEVGTEGGVAVGRVGEVGMGEVGRAVVREAVERVAVVVKAAAGETAAAAMVAEGEGREEAGRGPEVVGMEEGCRWAWEGVGTVEPAVKAQAVRRLVFAGAVPRCAACAGRCRLSHRCCWCC